MISKTSKGEWISAILGLAGAAAAAVGMPAYMVGKMTCNDAYQKDHLFAKDFFSGHISSHDQSFVEKRIREIRDDFSKCHLWRKNGLSAALLGTTLSLGGLALFLSYRKERLDKEGFKKKKEEENAGKKLFTEPCSYRNLELYCARMYKPYLDGAEINKNPIEYLRN